LVNWLIYGELAMAGYVIMGNQLWRTSIWRTGKWQNVVFPFIIWTQQKPLVAKNKIKAFAKSDYLLLTAPAEQL